MDRKEEWKRGNMGSDSGENGREGMGEEDE